MMQRKQRISAFLLALVMLFSTGVGNVNIKAKADDISQQIDVSEDTTSVENAPAADGSEQSNQASNTAEQAKSVWTKVELSDITSEDKIAVSMTTSAGKTYLLPTQKPEGNKAPAAVESEPAQDNSLKIAGDDQTYGWTITKTEDNSYQIKSVDKYLYITASDAKAKIGSTQCSWKLTEDKQYLYTTVAKKSKDDTTENITKYLGVYETGSDWRAYDNTGSNIKGQSVAFYKFSGMEQSQSGQTTPTAPVLSDIEKLAPTTSSSENITAGSVLTLQCGTISDVTYEIKQSDDTWKAIEGNTYTVPEGEAGKHTLEIRAAKDGKYSQTLTVNYEIADNKPDSSETTTLPEIQDGKYVIWNPKYNVSVSSEKKGYYYIGESVSGALDNVSGYTNSSLWDIKKLDSGKYTIEQSGKYLGLTSGKLTVDANPENKEWEISQKDGHYYLKCNEKNLEWYSKFSDWSAYQYSDKSDDAFWFYITSGAEIPKEETPKEETYTTDKNITQTIAQWGGGSNYTENQMKIAGDCYEVGDQKSKDSVYKAVINGQEVTPFTTSTSTQTGSTSYYMGGKGLGSGTDDYMQFELPSKGWGDMKMSFRLRVSGTGAGEWQLQYSKDGQTFKNMTTGSYTGSYTKYSKEGAGETVNLDGKITNGIAKTSVKSGIYINYTFDIPAGALNADKLYIRLVPSSKSADNADKATSAQGTARIDTVKITGHPIVDNKITGYVKVSPDGIDEVQPSGTELTCTTATENAAIQYRFVDPSGEGNEDWQTYNNESKPTIPSKLPAVLQVKASKEGLSDSVTRTLIYEAGRVSNVKMSPNGGGVYIADDKNPKKVKLSCDTKGATIYYSVDSAEESSYQVYDPETTNIELAKGFGTRVIRAYAVMDGFTKSDIVTRTFTERETEKYNIYFGQMHAHTSYSDGAGTAEDAYKHASGVSNLDFLALTDHSNSFDNADKSELSEDASQISNEWKEGKALAKKYTTKDFTSLFGFEMTWSNGLGHINTFNTPGFQSRTQKDYTTYSTALQNYYKKLKTVGNSISQFNHPGTTFGDFSDFAYYDDDIDQLITLIEVGNGEGAVGSSSYFPSYEYYTRALDKGWHVAPTNNQDNHKGMWGNANTARSVVLANSLDEDSIYDAMRNYRVYATEDNDLSVYYTLDDNIMGTRLSKSDVGDTVKLKASLSDPTDSAIGKVAVIVNGGQKIAEQDVTSNKQDVEFDIKPDYSYYYLRITQPDGNIAVTAPVWIGNVEAVGINDFSTKSSLAVQGEPVDLSTTLYNNEKKPLEISKIEYSVKDAGDNTTVIKTLTGDELTQAGMNEVGNFGTKTYNFDYVYDKIGKTSYEVTVTGTLNGSKKQYKEKLELNYVPDKMVAKAVVDGTHYNDYVTGYYGGNMSNFTALGADEQVKVKIAGMDKPDKSLTKEEWQKMLSDCSLLVVSAPARTSGTANAGNYEARAFEDWFIDLVADYVKKGGNVVVCGLADYQDTKAADKDHHAAAQLNKLLKAIGSTMSINDDEAYDGTNNAGQAYRLRPEKFDMQSKWLNGVITKEQNAEAYQKYSQYSGCTVDAGKGTPLVSGFDTTFSIDSDKDGIKALDETENVSGQNYKKVVKEGNAVFLASEDTKYGGTIFAAGGVFISDFEVKYDKQEITDLPYANTNIAKNILRSIKSELPYTDIQTVREAANAGKSGEVFRVKGRVTCGREKDENAFFDGIYLQDDTAGIDIFPYAEKGLKLGTEMEVTGYIDSYQGDLELKVMSAKILDDKNLKPVEPTELTCAQASDYEKYGGLLTKVTGTVKEGSVYYNSDNTLAQFVVSDGTGDTTIFIDGYIMSGTTGKNTLASFVKPGQKISAVGVQYMHPEVFVPGVTGNVSVLRVRDCDEITLVKDSGSGTVTPGGGNTNPPTVTPGGGNTNPPTVTPGGGNPNPPTVTPGGGNTNPPTVTPGGGNTNPPTVTPGGGNTNPPTVTPGGGNPNPPTVTPGGGNTNPPTVTPGEGDNKPSGNINDTVIVNGNTKMTVTVKKDNNGNVTANAKLSDDGIKTKNGYKSTITSDVVAKAVKTAGTKNITIHQNILDENGKTAYRIAVNAKDIKAGNKLTVAATDSETGDTILTELGSVKVRKDGSVNVTAKSRGNYVLLNEKDAAALEKEVLNSVKPSKKSATVKKDKKITLKLDDGLNMKNVSKITYQPVNKKVVSVNKSGVVKANKKGTTTVKINVTLKNGAKKLLKVRVTSK